MKINQLLAFAGLFLIITVPLQAQIITTVAGTDSGGYNGDGIPATAAELSAPLAVTIDGNGNIYIADQFNFRIRRVDAISGIITTVAGNGYDLGNGGYSGDGGPATSAELSFISDVKIDGGGNIYIADTYNNCIRKVDAITGIISTVAGNGYGAGTGIGDYNGDSIAATAAELNSPSGIAIDGSGNLYIADTYNNRIRKVDAITGIISTVAGTDSSGYNGDSIPATAAELWEPADVAIDGSGNLYIADLGNSLIRKVDAMTGIISRAAGYVYQGYNGDSIEAIVAELNFPSGVTIDGNGNLYIADQGNNRIRRVDAVSGIISTVAGNGTSGYNGDAIPATTAELNGPWGVAIDGNGYLYIADAGNNRVRKVPTLSTSFYVVFAATNANCTNNGSINSSVFGGDSPYAFLWNTGDTTANLNALSNGIYYLTVTDDSEKRATGYISIQKECNSIITGTCFNDVNGDCVFDSSDQLLNNQLIEITTDSGNSYYGTSGANGFFTVEVPESGTMYLAFVNQSDPDCTQAKDCNNAGDTIFIPNLGDTVDNVNFAINFGSGFDLTLHPGWTSANPGFTKQYWVMPYNLMAVPAPSAVTVVFNYDSNLIYQSSQSALSKVDIVNHTLTWVVSGSTIPVGTYNWYNERFISNFLVPSSLSTDYQLQSTFTILPYTGDCKTSNNELSFSEVVTGSHDPNAKEVSPAGELSPSDSVLTYTIFYQNTGSAATNFITVVDTLSPNLQPASVVNLASSDNYTSFNISGTGILTWMFNPVHLPPAVVDSVSSKGFITFSVHTKPGLQSGSAISNSGTIYFDYNTGIQTNTVTNTVAGVTAIAGVQPKNITISAFPNPFNEQTHITVSGISQKYDFELFDLTGRLQVNFQDLSASEFNLQRGELPAGVYLYRVATAGEPVGYGKLVVE